MDKHILFIHRGGGEEDYAADAKLVASLQTRLGDDYVVHYPFLPDDTTPDFGRKKQIDKQLSLIQGEAIIVAHSLGASMLLQYLSESKVKKKIGGIFLIATPFWSGDEDWKNGLKLQDNFAEKLPKGLPVFLYHSKDDEEVPFNHMSIYARHLTHATIREINSGGHHLNGDLSMVGEDIKSLEYRS